MYLILHMSLSLLPDTALPEEHIWLQEKLIPSTDHFSEVQEQT